ncbi:hypothetical protein [Thioclava pacifica]|uniref:DUF3313 domain-containing protein n=1 Tax=Thioclava pacifica DSM 10166 TaxID=1353537 RepID=A0A074J4R2_9RHOB|nr:hypothetical protein [Thioclava pacifica]KEO50920.1 hypothetical protein TP2_13610 [Thioclava pacifica DSM 10166]
MRFDRFLGVVAGIALLGLSGCVETSQTGLPTGAQAKYARIGLVADVGDRVMSSYWQAALSEPQSTEGRLGWNAAGAATEMVRAQLQASGAKVTSVAAPSGPAAQGNEVVIVLKQAPLNKLGQDYNPGRDFFALGGGLFAIIAVAGASETKDANFQPRFVLWIRNPEADKAWIGENACTVGLQAALVDPATGKGVTQGIQVTGRTIIPGKLTAKDWDRLPKAEKAEVLGACRSALNSAVSQALLQLDVVK